MNYSQTLDYLYNTLPMFSRMGSAAFKKDLTNIKLLCDHLGNPQKDFKTIHIGGTNGKGSVSHMLAAVLQMAGYKTGLYTSPHLKDFRERIKVNGQMVSEDFVVRFVKDIKLFSESIQPSFFEITVAMAFEYFKEQEVDVAVLEVGLGGRLDSTNIIHPELSIITNIGWDHMAMLGNSLQEIATEKGGIIKRGVPVVIGERKKESDLVFEKLAKEKSASLYFAEDHYKVTRFNLQPHSLQLTLQKGFETFYDVETDLPGIYQTKNVVTLFQSIDLLKERGFDITIEQVRTALAQTQTLTGLQGRWQVVHQSPTIVLEVAHNKDGVTQMLEHLKLLTYRQLHIIIGMVKDKDVETVLALLPPAAQYYYTQAHIPRAMPAEELEQKGAHHELKGNVYSNVNIALQQALQIAEPEDLIIVCGSIFLVAEVNIPVQ